MTVSIPYEFPASKNVTPLTVRTSNFHFAPSAVDQVDAPRRWRNVRVMPSEHGAGPNTKPLLSTPGGTVAYAGDAKLSQTPMANTSATTLFVIIDLSRG